MRPISYFIFILCIYNAVSQTSSFVYIDSNAPDSQANSTSCLNSTKSLCNFRSAVATCQLYLQNENDECIINFPPRSSAILDPQLGEIILESPRGSLVVRGYTSEIAPQTTHSSMRLMNILAKSSPSFQLSLYNLIISNFSSSLPGGALYLTNANSLTIIDVTFRNNSGSSGGAIYMDIVKSVTISSSFFLDNSATSTSGGGLHFQSYCSNILITNCDFTNNSAPFDTINPTGQAGAVYFHIENTNIMFTNSIFKSNRARYGGAVYLNSDNTDVLFNQCIFDTNVANMGGGLMLYNRNLDVRLLSCVLRGNSADGYYGLYTSPSSPAL
jgi:predicted outer membrane repeat protein